MDIITKSLSREEIARIEPREGLAQAPTAPAPPPTVHHAQPRQDTAVVLEFPVEHEGVTYTSIDVGNPAMGVIEEIQEAAANLPLLKLSLLMIARFADVPIEVARKLRLSDHTRVMDSIVPFGTTTGGGSDLPSSVHGPASPTGAPASPNAPTF